MSINNFPTEAVKFMERHGIERDSFSFKDDDVYIEIDDVDIAFDFREIMLNHASCCLISHPLSRKPTLQINNYLTQNEIK